MNLSTQEENMDERLNGLDITLVEMQRATLPRVSTDIGKLSYLWEQLN